LEPQLDTVLKAAASVRDTGRQPYFCANEVWNSWRNTRDLTLKQWLSVLVGWDRYDADPVLSTPKSYECAVSVVYEALPPVSRVWVHQGRGLT
jgi:hypothetical protein